MPTSAAFAPDAQIDLVVGSWNADLARAIAAVTSVDTLDAAWLARDGGGLGLSGLLRAARRWRRTDYDLAINFEPDVRSNLLAAASGAAWTAGYRSGGGGPLLDVALEYDTRAHTTDNAQRLVAAVFGRRRGAAAGRILVIPQEAHERAARLLCRRAPGLSSVFTSAAGARSNNGTRIGSPTSQGAWRPRPARRSSSPDRPRIGRSSTR